MLFVSLMDSMFISNFLEVIACGFLFLSGEGSRIWSRAQEKADRINEPEGIGG